MRRTVAKRLARQAQAEAKAAGQPEQRFRIYKNLKKQHKARKGSAPVKKAA